MEINTLVSALNLNKTQLKNQNLQGDVIVIDQSDKNDFEEITDEHAAYKIYSYPERGIGRSRNSALLRTTAEVALLADDDEVFADNYQEMIINGYEKYPDADIILFNVKRNDLPNKIKKDHEVNLANALKYGAVNISFKTESIRRADIYFSNNFGGGARFGSGEDSKFIVDCLKAGLKIVAMNQQIATIIDERESTWFKGYNDTFFFDKGALFSAFNIKSGLLIGSGLILRSFKNKGTLTNKEKLLLFKKGYSYYQKYSRNK
ncbi:glycosyltransferase [Macrococcoides bohemicum]|uniref:glycosyltransferase n=1 Tax=Macrococcoides bohemicum TaxID=1903056 RepID=UPI00165E0A2F|nr:glycosyltransferase [Macrococcus bohemicus]MBC9875437.1 glycosyltransferase family 2 protein [Macrococcus bohemicus]